MQKKLSTVDAFIGGEHLATLLHLRRENALLRLLAFILTFGLISLFLFNLK